jgi:CHAT domain-containing protein
MKLQRIGLVALFTLLTTLSFGDFQVVSNSQSKTLNAVALAQTPEARKAEADRFLQQGLQQFNTRQFEAALPFFQQALIIYRQIKDRQGEAYALGNIGSVYGNLGNLSRAIDYFKQGLAIAQEINDPQLETLTQRDLSLAQRRNNPRKAEADRLIMQWYQQFNTSQLEAGLESLQKARTIYQEIKDRKGEGTAFLHLGRTYINLGNYPKAIKYSQQSLTIAREIKDRELESAALGNLGFVYFDLGDYPSAINYALRQLNIAQEIKDRYSEGAAYNTLGGAYRVLGDHKRSIEYFQQYLTIARERKNLQSESIALGNLGTAYSSFGDYPKAIQFYQQYLAIARKFKNRRAEGSVLVNLGNAYLFLGDYPKAIKFYQQSLVILREIKDPTGQGNALNSLGVALLKQGNLTTAEATLTNAIEVYESIRIGLKDAEKISIFETHSNPYHNLQKVLVSQNKTNTALEVAERGRARAFVELLAQRLSANSLKKSTETILKPTIAQIQQIAKAQNATLVQYSIISDKFSIQDKQQWKESELYIWIIKPTGEVIFRKSDLKPLWQEKNTTLANLVINSRESIGVRGITTAVIASQPTANQTERLQQLHQILIEPIADLLPSDPNSRVIFVPQSSLFLVPFPALQDKSGKYLIEKHTILTAPSIQVLELTRQQKQKSRTTGEALVLGNPIMPTVSLTPGEPPQQLSALPAAEKEAMAIANLLKTQAVTGSSGTKANVVQKMPTARIIHLATHGLLDDLRGLGSAIALTPSGNDNGLLTAEEILDLKLSADLVVLSACDTGRGRITGDGVVGLSRSFISAGVPSVIVSLWAVPDAPTAELMTAFYQNLQTNSDKAQALRQAMLKMMKTYPHPKDWAAFILIGEAE